MIKQKRYERILDIINELHAVSIDEFCNRLNVSKATVRRDLIYLDEQKLLKRTHGGAVSLVKPAIEDLPIALRHRLYKSEKEHIAEAALDLIHDGDTVYIGTGTTMRLLAQRLRKFSHLTVLTNDIGVAYEVSQGTENGLIVSGGQLTPSTATLVGNFAEATLRDLSVDIAFMSVDAVSITGFMDLNTDEVAIKRLMLSNARKRIMLCDNSKFGREAFMTICPLSSVDLTITNNALDVELEQKLLNAGIVLQNV